MKTKSLTLPDLVVLSVLSEEPMHGYQLVSTLEERDVHDWAEISRPQVYYSIKKLQELKMIEEAKDSDPLLGPDRTKFRVNEKGFESLAENLSKETWATQRPPPPFLTWMALSSHLTKPALRKIIESRRSFLENELKREKATLKSFDGGSGAMHVAGRLMVDFTVQSFELELRWLDRVENGLLNRKPLKAKSARSAEV